MIFHLVPLAFLFTTVLSSGDTIVAAIGQIANATVALNKTVATFPNGVLGVVDTIPLLTDSATLLADIDAGTRVAQVSTNLTIPEAFEVAVATSSLVATVQETLTTVMDAKAKFDKLIVISPTILLNLKLEKDATDKFSAAVVNKIPEALQDTALSLIAPIDTAFDQAITVYD